MAAHEDLLEKGFQLAYFIFPSRTLALRILTGALNKLKAQRGRENRRAYWRDKYLKRGITRISREEQDTLQWLIFFESDRFEKEQEAAGEQTLEEMAVRYIKHLVRMTTAMSSFYVNLGVHRLLHNYSTAETQRVYETVTERYLGADEYRRAKGALMGKLERRFGSFLRTFRTQHGELRFEACQDQRCWASLAEVCLGAFIPWSTAKNCPVPCDFGLESGKLPPQLAGVSADKMDHDEIEINRCHAFIDPVCYGRLTRALAFDPPEEKLCLPRFFMEDTTCNDKPNRSPQTPLTPEERKAVSGYLSSEAGRRRRAAAQFVTVAVDGAEVAKVDFSAKPEHSFEIQEGAELVEIRTTYQGEDVVLATNRVTYTEAQGIAPSRSTIFLRGGRRLLLEIAPVAALPATGTRRAVMRLSYRPSVLETWRAGHPSLWAGIRYATAASVLVIAGWILGLKTGGDHRQIQHDDQPASLVAAVPSPSLPTAQQHPTVTPLTAISSYTLTADDLMVRGAGGSDVPSVMVPARPALLRLRLPIAASDAHKALRATLHPFLSKTDLLSESLPRVESTSSDSIATFWVPSALLQNDQDYSVDLRSRNASGGWEEVGSYTFRTVAEPAVKEEPPGAKPNPR